MSVRVYGRVQGRSSHAQVTAGFVSALRTRGMLQGIVPLDLGAISDEVLSEKDELYGRGAAAEHGVFTGALGHVETMLQHASHRRRWVMVAPNSTRIPDGLVREIRRVATDLMAPSAWAADVLRSLFDLPVWVVPHGIDPGFRVDPAAADERLEAYEHGYFNVVHFSTSDRERKGTFELLQAWDLAMRGERLLERSQLILVLDTHAKLRLLDRVADSELTLHRVTLLDRLDASPERMAYALGRAHVVCQPSRGEAFGLVPLEALAIGVPVVLTHCTGHTEYLNPQPAGACLVPHGPLAPIDDVPGAVGPTVSPKDIVESLWAACFAWRQLHELAVASAPEIQQRWAWSRVLGPFITQLIKEAA